MSLSSQVPKQNVVDAMQNTLFFQSEKRKRKSQTTKYPTMKKKISRIIRRSAILSTFATASLHAVSESKVNNLNERLGRLEKKVNRIEKAHAPAGINHPDNVSNVHIYGDFVFLYAQENGLPYGVLAERDDTGNTDLPKEILYPDFRFLPGFRVGIGFNSGLDDWNFYLDWLHLHGKARDSKSTAALSFDPNSTNILNPWSGLLDNNFANFAFGRWKIDLNQVDAEVARNYWASSNMALKPSLGVRGTRLDTRYFIHNTREDADNSSPYDEKIHLNQDLKGVGPVAKLGIEWAFNEYVSFLGNLGLALLYADYDITVEDDLLEVNSDTTTSLKLTNDFYSAQAVIDLVAGFRFGYWFNRNTSRVSLFLGWEEHLYPQYGQLPRFSDSNFSGDYSSTNGQLSLGGLDVKLQVDF